MNGAYCGKCDLVVDPMYSQEGASQILQSVLEISRNSGIHRSSLGQIHSWFLEPPTQIEQRAYSLANVFSGSVATQLRWGGKLCRHLEATICWILCAENYEQFQAALSYRIKPRWHFLRHMAVMFCKKSSSYCKKNPHVTTSVSIRAHGYGDW